MANNEKFLPLITTNTSTEGEFKLLLEGQCEFSVSGTFNGATVAYHSFSEQFGRGASIRTAATAEEAFASNSRYIEFVVSGVWGSTSLEILGRPLLYRLQIMGAHPVNTHKKPKKKKKRKVRLK